MYHRYNHASTQPRQLRFVTQNEDCCTIVVSLSTERSCIREKPERLSPCCATATSSLLLLPRHHSWPLPMVDIFGGSNNLGIQQYKVWAVWWMGKNSYPSFVMASFVFKVVYVSALSCWRRISAIFLWGLTLLASWCKVLRVQMHRCELIDWLHDIIYTRLTSSASQKHWLWLLSWSGILNSFLLRRSWMVPFH